MNIYMPLWNLKPSGFCILRYNTFPGYRLAYMKNNIKKRGNKVIVILDKNNTKIGKFHI